MFHFLFKYSPAVFARSSFVLLGQWPLIVSNSICLALSGFILMMKLLPRRAKDKVADAVTPKT